MERFSAGRPEIDEKGRVATWPVFCDHCGETRWVRPNERIDGPLECRGSARPDNPAVLWRNALLSEAQERARSEA